MNIGAKIRSCIEEAGVTNRNAAKMLGISENALYKIYNKENLSTELIGKVSTLFNVPLSYFFDDGKGKGNVTNIGKGNIAVSGNENKNFLGEPATPYGTKSEVSELKEKVQHLVELLAEKDKLIAEKERLIKMLLKEEKLK